MESKPPRWQFLARQDAQRAVDWYIAEAGADVADRFAGSMNEVIESIEQFPSLGSRRQAEALGFESLRFREIPRFPYLIFYIEFEKHVVIWRVLHRERDLPQQLS